MSLLTERYAEQIHGVLSCYDRVIVQGTLPGLCYAEGMSAYLSTHHIRIFDYVRFAEPLREELRANAEQLAAEAGVAMEFERHHDTRKEALIAKKIEKRGDHPGLVAVLSAMEACSSYKPWHDKTTGRTFLKPASGWCLHYYFYFLDEDFGLGYIRVPTWCPFRLQVYFNGHSWLAAQLSKRHIAFTLRDNAFTEIANWKKAQQLVARLNGKTVHRWLDRLARRYCPVVRRLGVNYHWSVMQAEYSTDLVFRHQRDLEAIYDPLARTAIHTVKPEHVATFLGRKLHGGFQDELGNDFHTRIEGTCIKHHMGPVSLKMYDKFGLILRIESTTNDLSFFKHYREVEQRDGQRVTKWAPLKKSIYSLAPLQPLLAAANRRYLEFLSTLDDPSDGVRALRHVSKTLVEQERSYQGFNFFDDADQQLFELIARGEFHISGFQNKNLRRHLPPKNCGPISRLLKRLRVHGLIRRIASTYKYYLTKLGQRVLLAGLKLKEFFLVPQLAAQLPA